MSCFISNLFKKKLLSFSLIESAVVLAVAGSVIGGGLKAYQATNPKVQSDLKKIQAIEDALQQFFNTNGRLPFPARAEDTNGATYYLSEYKTGAPTKYSQGVYRNRSSESVVSGETYAGTTSGNIYCKDEACTTARDNYGVVSQLAWGVVPTRALGLPDDYAYDSQGHNFEYIIDAQMALPNGITYLYNYQKANYNTSNDGRYQVFYTTTDVSYKPFSMDLFKLSIVNNKTSKTINGTYKNTAYVVMSKGKSGKCWWNNRGDTLQSDTTIPTDNTKYNCQANYTSGSFATLSIYQGYSKDFDNIVKYRTLNELIYAKANSEEAKNEVMQGSIISYQPRDDVELKTSSKNIVAAINEIFDRIYPVGSVYISVNSTNPSTIFGGTWQQITGRYLLASTTSKTTGGSSTISLSGLSLTRTKNVTIGTHYLTTSEIPSHRHHLKGGNVFSWGGEYGHWYDGNCSVGVQTNGPNMGSDHNHYVRAYGLSNPSSTSSWTNDGNNWNSGLIVRNNNVLCTNQFNWQHTAYTGGDGGHNHPVSQQPEFSISSSSSITYYPPYFTVYVWYRTA